MQRIGLLNGNNITYDKDNTAGLLASLTAGVIEGFGTSGSGATTNVQSGKALIECTRTNGEKVMVYFENTANVVVDFTGTKKVYITVDQAKLDDGSNNAEDGTGVASIQTGASYPASNYVALYSIASGTPTDERVGVKSKLARTGFTPYRLCIIDQDGNETFLEFGENGTALVSGGPSVIPSWVSPSINIVGLTEKTSIDANDLGIISDSIDSNINKKIKLLNLLKSNIAYLQAGENITIGDALYIHTDGKVYKTDASSTGKINFCGFAGKTTNINDYLFVRVSGIEDQKSGLNPGSKYYLLDAYNYTTGSEYVNDPYSTTNRQTGNRYYMQKFVADFKMVSSVKAHVACTFPSSSSVNMTCDIYNVSGGVPTTLLKSGPTINVAYDGDSNFATEYSFDFTWNVGDAEMTVGNTYAIVFSAPSDSYQIGIAYPNTLTTTYGSGYKYNGASSWTTSTNDANINITGKNYTGPFNGLISTTPGTNNVLVGKAVKTTELLIKSGSL